MKILNFLGIFCILLFGNCQSTQNFEGYEILSAEYSIVAQDEFEKGYEVNLKYNSPSNTYVKSVILNQFKFNVGDVLVSNGGVHSIASYYPLQSKMIQNFTPPETDKRKDGIIFEINGQEIYQEIKFKLK